LDLPELDSDLLDELGDFEDEAAFREVVKSQMERQLSYHQNQRIREQILEKLTETADWELPPSMLRKQGAREFERAVLELRRSGFNEEQIRSHEALLRQRSMSSTSTALKEHFVLERIAEENEIEETYEDYEMEISLIAMQTNQNPRRVRAQLEKNNSMDVLRNQIIERKVLALIQENAKVTDVPHEDSEESIESVVWAAAGDPVPDEPSDAEEDSE
jgi:trigger factor